MITEVIVTNIATEARPCFQITLDKQLLGIVYDKDLAEWFGQEVKYQLNKVCVEKMEDTDVEGVPDLEEVRAQEEL